jgi:GPH family glycoside/pentoside/hexuronide:cation symporter
MGVELMIPAFVAYYVFYYVDILGLAVRLLAIIKTIHAIWDAINDPIGGWLSDNTRSTWGRRRPWIITALPLLMVLLVLGYAVPAPFRGGTRLFLYALMITFLFETAATVVSVNYQALFPRTLLWPFGS